MIFDAHGSKFRDLISTYVENLCRRHFLYFLEFDSNVLVVIDRRTSEKYEDQKHQARF